MDKIFLSPVQVFYTFSSFFLVAHAPVISDGAAFGLKTHLSRFSLSRSFWLSLLIIDILLQESFCLDSSQSFWIMQRIGRRSASRQDLMPSMLIVQFTFILTQETNGECIIWGRKAKFVQVELLSKKFHLPNPGWIQNSRRQKEEEQAADQRILGSGPTSELCLRASSCPVVEVSPAHRLLLLTNYFQPSFTWPWDPSLCLLWVPIDPTSSQVSWNLCDPCKPYLSRVFRDEEKCSGKYGAGWKTYCEQVQRIVARA